MLRYVNYLRYVIDIIYTYYIFILFILDKVLIFILFSLLFLFFSCDFDSFTVHIRNIYKNNNYVIEIKSITNVKH